VTLRRILLMPARNDEEYFTGVVIRAGPSDARIKYNDINIDGARPGGTSAIRETGKEAG